jgi:dTDP-glucose 4,6-dehydratase
MMLSTEKPTLDVLGLESPVFIGQTKFPIRPDSKNILITGGAGFIASYVTRHFVVQYPEYLIVVYDKLDYCSSLNNLASMQKYPNFVFEKGDITDADRTREVLEAHKIDTIMHFAAQSHVDLSFGNSFSFTKNNVIGTHVLLECAKTANIKLFLHVSTDEVYGEVNPSDPDLLETAILCPTNPYSASKAAAEMLVNAYSKSFKLPVMIVRSNNVYVPHQFPEKVIPKFISLLNRGRKMILHGDGSPTRKYLFGSDAAEAFDVIFHKGSVGEIYNIGSYDEIANKDLCGLLLEQFGVPQEEYSAWIEFCNDRPFNDMRYSVDCSKLIDLGWKQRTSFSEGLQITIAWYQKFGEKWWGDVSHCLSAFPELKSEKFAAQKESHHDLNAII